MGIQGSTHRIEFMKKSSSISSESTASSIPKSPLDIDVEHLETFTLVWLDRYIDEDENNQELKRRLREHTTSLITFNDFRSCEQWLKNRSTDEKILLIVTGDLGTKLIPTIHQLPSIIAIYVFCWKPEIHTMWTPDYPKIRGVITKEEILLQKISTDQIYFENIEDFKSLKIVKTHPHSCILDVENISFLWYQLFLEILLSSSYFPLSSSANQFIEILRRYNSNDKEILNLIKQFEENYQQDECLNWLTNNTPLARFINKALRQQNISILFYLRFFLMDIFNQLTKHQLSSIHVYRKQIMLKTNIQNIQNNINNYLIFNQFLYTYTEPSDISSIDKNDQQFETVFIEIDAEYQDGTVPFAYLEKGIDQNNSTIIFMCGAIFKIVSLTKNKDSNWSLHLLLSGNKDFNILADKKQKLRQTKDLLIIVELLDQSNQSNKANIYYQHLLRELPSNHPQLPQIKAKINLDSTVHSGIIYLSEFFFSFYLVSLRTVQFIVIDLSKRLSSLASSMLESLRSLTNDSILISDHNSDIDFDKIINKTILFFSSVEFFSSMKQKPRQLTQYFLLEEDNKEINQPGRFNNSEDIIFQLADELYHCYKWESKEDLRSGNTDTAKQKEELANQIHSNLKKIHQIFSKNDNESISVITTIVWLKSENTNENNIQQIQNLFENIIPSFSIFNDEHECHEHIVINEYNHSVFLIIDNDYKDISVIGFKQLNNVKQIHRYKQLSSTKDTINQFSIKLIHDLIDHYNQLGNQFEDRNDTNNAKDMFLKARHLCQIIVKL